MGVKTCSVRNCQSSVNRKEDQGVTFQKFPKNTDYRKKWYKATQIEEKLNIIQYVCSRHFRKIDFETFSDSKYMLRTDAVPSIFPYGTSDTLKHKTTRAMDDSTIEKGDNPNEEIQLKSVTDMQQNNDNEISKDSEDFSLAKVKAELIQETDIKQEPLLGDSTPCDVWPSTSAPDTNIISEIKEMIHSTEEGLNSILSGQIDHCDGNIEICLSNSPKKKGRKKEITSNNLSDLKSSKGDRSPAMSVGTPVEAKDFGEMWHPARIVEVDDEELEVLVRFDNWSQRHDEWISMSSPRLRQMCEVTGAPLEYKEPRPGSPSEKMTPIMYKVGERCLARWSDNRRFPATVRSVVGNGKYEIIFDDGFVRVRRWSQLYKVKDPQKALSNSSDSNVHLPLSPIPYGVRGELSPMLSASPPPVLPVPLPFHKHLFDPSRDYLGPKSERRAMKRKLDVKVLFNIGKRKYHKTSKKPDVPVLSEKAPTVEKKRGRKKKIPPTDVKVEDTTEVCTGLAEAEEHAGEPLKILETVKTEISDESEVKLETDTNHIKIKDVGVVHIPGPEIKNEDLAVEEIKKDSVDTNGIKTEVSNVKTIEDELLPEVDEKVHVSLKEYILETEVIDVLRECVKEKKTMAHNEDETTVLEETQKNDTSDGKETEKIIKSPKLILKRTQNDTWNKTLKDVDVPDKVKEAFSINPKKETESKLEILNKNPKVILQKADLDKHNKEVMDALKQERVAVEIDNKEDFEGIKLATLKSKKLHKLQKEIIEKAAALELIRSQAKKKKSKKSKEKHISNTTDKDVLIDKGVIPSGTSNDNLVEGANCTLPHEDAHTPPVASTSAETNNKTQESCDSGLMLIADVVAGFHTQQTKPDVKPVVTDNSAKASELHLSAQLGCDMRSLEDVLKELREDQWCCRWVNGEPEGIVSELEVQLDPRCVTNNAEPDKAPLPRKSVQVVDKRLPPGWSKHLVRRSWGSSAGQWDVVHVDPKGKRLRDRGDMRTYLLTGMTAELEPYLPILYDFSAHRKLSRIMGLDVTRDELGVYRLVPLPMGSATNSPLTSTSRKRKPPNAPKSAQQPSKKKKPSVPNTLTASNANGDAPRSSTRAVAQTPVITSMITDGNPLLGTPVLPLEDGYVYVGSMRVQIVDSLFRCPDEDCVKNFRKDNLLRMHIKHYHRKMSKLLGSTPKVSDLAYARTAIPEDMVVPKLKCEVPSSSSRPSRAAPKTPVDRPERRDPIKTEMYVDTHLKAEPGERKPSLQDSPKLRSVLEHQNPVKRPKVHYPVKKSEQSLAHIDEYYGASDARLKEESDDVKTSDEHCGEQYQEYEHLDFEAAISTHTVTKAANWSKHKARQLKRRRPSSDAEDWEGSDGETRSSYGTPDSRGTDRKLDALAHPATPLMGEAAFDEPNFMLNETGEKIKIVQMKREEIINCHCGFGEEDGLMIQCELCLCWQHAVCHNIERESQVPDKYVCSICLNPRRGRRSRRFLHDQGWLYEGQLPGGAPDSVLRRSHELSGNLIRIADVLHTLRVKYHVANKKDHPKLYLWAKDWEKVNGLQEKVAPELLHSDYAELSAMISEIGKENLPLKSEEIKEMSLGDSRTPLSEDTADSQRDEGQLGLANLLSSPGGHHALDLPISTSDLERLANSVQEPTEAARSAAPEPEAAIESTACRANLLKHIQRCQAILDARLDSIEAQVAELESQDPSLEDDETAEFFPRTKQTIQMLLRDLDTMEELGNVT